MITALEIENYRGIKHCKIEGLKQVNILIGRNNAGKSSILEALYFASAEFEAEDPIRERNKITYLVTRRTGRDVNEIVLFHNYNKNAKPRITISLNGQEPFIMECGVGKKYEGGKMEYYTECGVQPALPSKKEREFFTGAVMVDETLIRKLQIIEDALWSKLLPHRLDKVVIEALREGYEMSIEDLTYVRIYGNTQLVVKLPDTFRLIDDLGDGAKYAIVLTMIAATMHDSLLLIEEPEGHQHPGGLAKAMNVLLRLVKRNNLQVFMSTHSRELCIIVEELAKKHDIKVSTFFIERNEEGEVTTRRISPKGRKILELLGLDARFLDLI